MPATATPKPLFYSLVKSCGAHVATKLIKQTGCWQNTSCYKPLASTACPKQADDSVRSTVLEPFFFLFSESCSDLVSLENPAARRQISTATCQISENAELGLPRLRNSQRNKLTAQSCNFFFFNWFLFGNHLNVATFDSIKINITCLWWQTCD